ncbi:YceD family protein [Thermanaeromonas sp. C210]|uniref:YceD family protein n=1 Tax=Thermanaeromonas sp. C210 TaxID=2731925 RepID=UPI00155C13FA|nr:DUF177 domain-containing protein [Thermanaeromonas sp. C210]GFN23984.1 hypothetical protein TAMC210_23010 [Thermanaeromonas sp. C210]
MLVEVGELKVKRGNRVEFDRRETWPQLDAGGESIPLTEPVRVVGEITNTGKFLYLQGKAYTTVRLRCCRCLEPYTWPLEVSVEEEYCTPNVFASLPEDDEARDEVRVYEGDSIDIAPAVREAFILALPMKWLCREECLGLCPVCGQNLNERDCNCRVEEIDPRMAVLAELLSPERREV